MGNELEVLLNQGGYTKINFNFYHGKNKYVILSLQGTKARNRDGEWKNENQSSGGFHCSRFRAQ